MSGVFIRHIVICCTSYATCYTFLNFQAVISFLIKVVFCYSPHRERHSVPRDAFEMEETTCSTFDTRVRRVCLVFLVLRGGPGEVERFIARALLIGTKVE